jgi:hypothetical protein
METKDSLSLLKLAKTRLLEEAIEFGNRSEWKEWQTRSEIAQGVDALLQKFQASTLPGDAPSQDLVSRTGPEFYIHHDRLVKRASSRGEGFYEHRITKSHYDLITVTLYKFSQKAQEFTSDELIHACPIPSHEPRLVLQLLHAEGLIRKVQRGRYRFATETNLRVLTTNLWNDLPRK